MGLHCSLTSYANLRIPMLEFRGADSRLNRARFAPLTPVGQLYLLIFVGKVAFSKIGMQKNV